MKPIYDREETCSLLFQGITLIKRPAPFWFSQPLGCQTVLNRHGALRKQGMITNIFDVSYGYQTEIIDIIEWLKRKRTCSLKQTSYLNPRTSTNSVSI